MLTPGCHEGGHFQFHRVGRNLVGDQFLPPSEYRKFRVWGIFIACGKGDQCFHWQTPLTRRVVAGSREPPKPFCKPACSCPCTWRTESCWRARRMNQPAPPVDSNCKKVATAVAGSRKKPIVWAIVLLVSDFKEIFKEQPLNCRQQHEDFIMECFPQWAAYIFISFKIVTVVCPPWCFDEILGSACKCKQSLYGGMSGGSANKPK